LALTGADVSRGGEAGVWLVLAEAELGCAAGEEGACARPLKAALNMHPESTVTTTKATFDFIPISPSPFLIRREFPAQHSGRDLSSALHDSSLQCIRHPRLWLNGAG